MVRREGAAPEVLQASSAFASAAQVVRAYYASPSSANMSGDEFIPFARAHQTVMNDAEVAAVVEEREESRVEAREGADGEGEVDGSAGVVVEVEGAPAAAADFLNLPSNRIVELGAKVEI